jgi:xylulokinase
MYLGIDIGTSGVKAVITDEAQSIIDEATDALTVSRPHPLWSEQDPQDWWRATNVAVKKLNPKARAAVKAIGLSGQMHGATCLDAQDKIIRPAILWNDGRSAQACEDMMKALPALSHITGNLAMAGFTAPKIYWMREHEPENYKRISKVLLPKDYVRLLMSGEYASDMSDSAGTLWVNVEKRAWSGDALALTGLTENHMPKLFEGSEATGKLLPEIADDWGMQHVPIAAGGGDNAAGAVGSGSIRSGEGFISLGTSGVVFLSDDTYQSNTDGAVHSFCHALPNLWHRMSVVLSAASAVDFVSKITGFEQPKDLYEAVAAARTPSHGPIFLPYLSGERTPHNDPAAKGAFFGMTHDDSPVTLAQAALEGVAFALADGIDVLRVSGSPIKTLSVIGGGAQSAWWGEVISSALNMPLTYRQAGNIGPAFGAARLARLSLGQDKFEEICTPPPVSHIIEPNSNMNDLYETRKVTYRQLYQSTKHLT